MINAEFIKWGGGHTSAFSFIPDSAQGKGNKSALSVRKLQRRTQRTEGAQHTSVQPNPLASASEMQQHRDFGCFGVQASPCAPSIFAPQARNCPSSPQPSQERPALLPAACSPQALSSDKAPAQQNQFVWRLFFFYFFCGGSRSGGGRLSPRSCSSQVLRALWQMSSRTAGSCEGRMQMAWAASRPLPPRETPTCASAERTLNPATPPHLPPGNSPTRHPPPMLLQFNRETQTRSTAGVIANKKGVCFGFFCCCCFQNKALPLFGSFPFHLLSSGPSAQCISPHVGAVFS